jgi:autoinducer 2-degrading protein
MVSTVAYSVVGTWRCAAGKEEEMIEILKELRTAVRAEPGCQFQEVQQSLADPRTFLIYGIYDDRAAFDTHLATEHVQRLGLTRAMAIRDDDRGPSDYYQTIG